MGSANCNIKMLDVKPEIVNHGFTVAKGTTEITWYKIVIPQTFRGKYALYLCKDDIYGVFQGIAIQDHDFDSLMSKIAFRTPEAVIWVKNLLDDLKAQGIIDFEVETWDVSA